MIPDRKFDFTPKMFLSLFPSAAHHSLYRPLLSRFRHFCASPASLVVGQTINENIHFAAHGSFTNLEFENKTVFHHMWLASSELRWSLLKHTRNIWFKKQRSQINAFIADVQKYQLIPLTYFTAGRLCQILTALARWAKRFPHFLCSGSSSLKKMKLNKYYITGETQDRITTSTPSSSLYLMQSVNPDRELKRRIQKREWWWGRTGGGVWPSHPEPWVFNSWYLTSKNGAQNIESTACSQALGLLCGAVGDQWTLMEVTFKTIIWHKRGPFKLNAIMV